MFSQLRPPPLAAMYEAITRAIRVRVTPSYLDDRSTPADSHYVWAYTIEITNEGSETVQLISRHWHITDANGHSEDVRGPGVVGQTPTLQPGESFTYSSGCPLKTPSGIMSGTYQMMSHTRTETFNITIPAFSLDSPYAKRSIN